MVHINLNVIFEYSYLTKEFVNQKETEIFEKSLNILI